MEWRETGGRTPPTQKRNGAELNCALAHTHTHTQQKKLARERTKTSGAERKGGKRRCLNRKEGSQTGSRSCVAALPLSSSFLSLSLFLSLSASLPLSVSLGLCLSLYLWHLSGVGPAPFMHSSCVCLSTHQPLLLVGIDRERRGKSRGWGGLTHNTKVAPTEAMAPHTLRIFTPYTHTCTHSSFSLVLCPIPLTALDIREGWDVRERIHIQISMTVTKTEKEC